LTDSKLRDRAKKILAVLDKEYPEAACSLDFRTPLELLVATILSAQCTDVRVNAVAVDLFRKYRSATDFAEADISELERDIRSTGFYKNKAKSIKACCAALVKEHGGEVPSTMEELVELQGVGRKTANVILGNAYGTPGIVVDTHVGRITQRLGLTKNSDPVKIEFDLMGLFPEKSWTKLSHQLIYHGRALCTARAPKCDACPALKYCDYGLDRK